MSYKNFQKGIGLQSTIVGLIGFIFAFSFLLSPKSTHAESCFGNVDPAKYVEVYLKSQQVETAVDVNKLIAQTLNIKSGGAVSLSDAIGVIVTSNKAILCFSNGDYSQGLKTLGGQATKIAIDKIAGIASGYSLVTLPANIVELGIEIFRNAINKVALNSITENYMLAMERCEQSKSRDSCHNRIVECSALSTAKNVHEPRICFDSDGYMFSNGWLIYPRPTEQSYKQPEFPFEKKFFYEGARAIYENKKDVDTTEAIKQNEQIAAGLINDALKKAKTEIADNNGGFFSNLWKGVKDFFTSPKETEIKPSDLSGQISNALSSNANEKEISVSQEKPNVGRTVKLRYKIGCDKNWGSPAPFVVLDWSVSYENMTSQTIYRDNEVILNVPPSAGPSYHDGTVKAGKTYNYSIKADYKDGYSNTAEANVVVAIDVCGPINPVQNETPASQLPSTSPAPSVAPPASSSGGGGSGSIPQTDTPDAFQPSQTPSTPTPSVTPLPQENSIIYIEEIGCEKRLENTPPFNPKHPRVAAVNVKWNRVTPFVKLKWGLQEGARYKIYRDGKLTIPGIAFDGADYFDGSVNTGTTYTYIVRSEYSNGFIQDSKPLKVAVPKDICGVVPYVNLKVNGTDGYVVASPLSTKFDVELTTFVGSENEGYGPCYKFAGDGNGGSWGMVMEPQDIYYDFDYETIYTYDNAPFLDSQSLSIICPTKEEEKQFLDTVSGFYITLPEILSTNLNSVNLMRLLASGLWLENRPQTGNFFGCWGCDLTLTHLLPYSHILEVVQKFRSRADAIQVVFSQYRSNAPVEIATKKFRPCQQSIKRGNFLDLEATMAGEPERLNRAVVILSADNNLDLKDIILGEVLHPVHLLQKCGNFDIIDHSFYIPDTMPSGDYFIGFLFRDGQQITAPLRVE